MIPRRPGYKPAFVTVRQRGDVRTDTPPAPSAWRMHNRNAAAADVYRDDNHMAAKLMLKAGRAQELAATYDGPVGLLSLRPNGAGARRSIARSGGGRARAQAGGARRRTPTGCSARRTSTITAVYRQAHVPFAFDADVAAIWAVQGRREQALSMLERAMRRGWTNSGSTDLPDIADEPAFRVAARPARFERLRATLAAHLARERAETVQLRL